MLGIQVDTLGGDGSGVEVPGWNKVERKLMQNIIADCQPFHDFVISRTNTDSSQKQFQVSGEPMFDKSSRFVGYRGIGVELTRNQTLDSLWCRTSACGGKTGRCPPIS